MPAVAGPTAAAAEVQQRKLDRTASGTGPGGLSNAGLGGWDGRRVVHPGRSTRHLPAGTTVLEAARALGVDLDSVCGARGICGRCQVEIGARPGVQADPARLSAPSTTELGYTGRRPFPDGRRLGCAARILDDVVIDVPESSQVHRQVVRKDAGRLEVPVDPVLALHYVEVDEPTMVDAIGELQRLRAALAKEWQLTGLEVDHSVLADLQPALERGKRGVTVAVRAGHDVVAVWPGLRDRAYGVAFDVGPPRSPATCATCSPVRCSPRPAG